MKRRGDGLSAIPADALITPAARDLLSTLPKEPAVPPTVAKSAAPAAPAKQAVAPHVPDRQFHWKAGTDPKTPEAIDAFFHSPPIEALKSHLCGIGRRLWEREYVDGNGGNLTVRVGDDLVLCTPTLISKGFMHPEEFCLVDFNGKQLAGTRKATSEVNTHIAIFKRRPEARACIHAHPVHATAFAVASIKPPPCTVPEADVFLGEIGLAPYETPGSPENARVIGEAAEKHQAILMENHGVIVWAGDIEDACWKMENTEAYCQTVWVASQLGRGLHTFGTGKLKELIEVRQKLGMQDPRADWKECELCDLSDWESTRSENPSSPQASQPADAAGTGYDAEAEAIVQAVTDAVLTRIEEGLRG